MEPTSGSSGSSGSSGAVLEAPFESRGAVDDAIDRLQEALDGARGMPSWAAGLVVVISLLCAVILIHVLALLSMSPCLYIVWKRRAARAERLLEEEEEEDGEGGEDQEGEQREEGEEGVRGGRDERDERDERVVVGASMAPQRV